MMTLLSGAAQLVAWCIAVVIGIAIGCVLFLWGYDKFTEWRHQKRVERLRSGK